MAIYPPNQTTPSQGSGNYLWNWLGSSLKKFGAAISPYIISAPSASYTVYTAKIATDDQGDPVVTVLENTTGLTINWFVTIESNSGTSYLYSNISGLDPTKVVVNGQLIQNYGVGTLSGNKSFYGVYSGSPGGEDLEFVGYIGVEINSGDIAPDALTEFYIIGLDASYAAANVTDMIGLNTPFCFEMKVYS